MSKLTPKYVPHSVSIEGQIKPLEVPEYVRISVGNTTMSFPFDELSQADVSKLLQRYEAEVWELWQKGGNSLLMSECEHCGATQP